MPSEHVVRKGGGGEGDVLHLPRQVHRVGQRQQVAALHAEAGIVLRRDRAGAQRAADGVGSPLPSATSHRLWHSFIPSHSPSGDRRLLLRHPHPSQRRPLPCDPRLPNVAIRLAEYAKQRLLERSRAQEAQKGFESLIDSLGELGIPNAACARPAAAAARRAPRRGRPRDRRRRRTRRPSVSGPRPPPPRSRGGGEAGSIAARGAIHIGDASATQLARAARFGREHAVLVDHRASFKANPIATAATLCNSSLDSSNRRIASAVATPVVRSRRPARTNADA